MGRSVEQVGQDRPAAVAGGSQVQQGVPIQQGVLSPTTPPLGIELRDSAVLLALCVGLLGLFAALASPLLFG